MTQSEIKHFLEAHLPHKQRTIVVVDFSNVEKWKRSLGWSVGIQELGTLAKSFAGAKYLRRFYYGSDYGPKESSAELLVWSESMLTKAKMNGFEVITKRVKYMPDSTKPGGYEVKCDLDVEMAVDLVRERDSYDKILLFSGDGDLGYALRYLHSEFQKECMVFGARDFVGREIVDARAEGAVKELFFAEDFEYRLSYERRIRR